MIPNSETLINWRNYEEIPEIPDLEEAVEPDEDKTFKIAEAPE